MSVRNTSIRVNITGDARALKAAFGDAATSAERFQGRMAGLSTALGKLAVPVGLAGAASVKLATDFSDSMQKMVSLVGLSQTEVDGMRDSILALAGETAKAPQELADAMFPITSAGLRGAEAMEALEQAAKASAAGMGDMTAIADAATSAMNAYGSENLSATAATDVLVAAVREGKLEADSLAGVLGKVIPVASAMGVEFNEVGASLAAMSRIGISAEEGSTALSSLLNAMLKPADDAVAALDSVGLSIQDVRDSIADDGPLAALQMLNDAFGGNVDQLGRVIPNVRAFKGALALLVGEGENANAIFEAMRDNTGDTADAFSSAAGTDAFALRQAFTELKVAGIALGEEAAPAVAQLATDVGNLAKAVGELDQDQLKAIVTAGKWTVGLWAASKAMAGLAAAWVFGGKILAGLNFARIAVGVKALEVGIGTLAGTVSGVLAGSAGLLALDEGLERIGGNLTGLPGIWTDAGKALAKFTIEVFSLAPAAEEAESATDSVAAAHSDFATGMRNASRGRRRVMEQEAEAAEEMADFVDESFRRMMESSEFWAMHLSKDVRSSIDMFAGLPAQVELTAEEFNQQLLDMITAADNWEFNLIRLGVMGMEGLADTFREKGPAAASLLEDLLSDPDLLRQAYQNAMRLGDTAWDGFQDGWNSSAATTRFGSGSGPGTGTDSTGFRLNSFDSGGVVPGAIGSPQLALVHGGETILPTHKKGFSGGRTVNITVNGSVLTERELVEVFRDELDRYDTRNAL